MTDGERDRAVAEALNAFREVDPRTGQIVPSSAWHDLDGAGRDALFVAAIGVRRMEAALDPEGLSTTARAVIARIRAGSR